MEKRESMVGQVVGLNGDIKNLNHNINNLKEEVENHKNNTKGAHKKISDMEIDKTVIEQALKSVKTDNTNHQRELHKVKL
jgi:predicted  nucleic acid-binding Zn-ribbon protein